MIKHIILGLFIICYTFLNAQEHEPMSVHNKNTLSIAFGYAYLPDGVKIESQNDLGHFVPSIGIDYIRKLSHKFELIAVVDFELDHYLVSGKDIMRENATIVVVGAMYNIVEHWSVMLGSGIEMDKHHQLFVARIGTEYGIHLSDKWILSPGIFYDYKHIHSTYSTSLALGYNF